MLRVRKAKVAAVTCAVALLSGCAHKQASVWTPKPLASWAHVSTQLVEPVYDGYRILPPHPTRGLFPASIAVTRVAITNEDDPLESFRPILLADPGNEYLQWNSTLDDQMAISEVFPVLEYDLGGGVADPEQIMAAFQALHASMGLMYAVNEFSETETEILGVLYDANSAQPVATLHAQVDSSLLYDEGEHEEKEPGCLWETDSRALVRAEFGRLLHDCIREMILRDEPASVNAPTGWVPALPIRPVEWPPRRFRRGG